MQTFLRKIRKQFYNITTVMESNICLISLFTWYNGCVGRGRPETEEVDDEDEYFEEHSFAICPKHFRNRVVLDMFYSLCFLASVCRVGLPTACFLLLLCRRSQVMGKRDNLELVLPSSSPSVKLRGFVRSSSKTSSIRLTIVRRWLVLGGGPSVRPFVASVRFLLLLQPREKYAPP